MRVQPLQQIVDYMVRCQSDLSETLSSIGMEIIAVKYRLWHGRVDRAIRDLEALLARLTEPGFVSPTPSPSEH